LTLALSACPLGHQDQDPLFTQPVLAAILSREYRQYGLFSGVDSVAGTRNGGVW
jgi:hypothetical protein